MSVLVKRALLRALSACLLIAGGAVRAETGVSESHILLGQSAPFSGPAAELGRRFYDGASAYFDMINASGGVHGRSIELIAADDQYEPDKTFVNTERLIEKDKVFALFGYVGTPTSLAALPLINKARIPFFAPVSGAQFLREPFNPLIFNIRASYAVEIDYMLKQLSGNGKSRIAVFYQNDAFGLSTMDTLRGQLKERNMTLLYSAPVERNSEDVTVAAKQLLAQDPEIVIEIAAYASAAALIKEMRKLGYSGGFYNLSFVGATTLATIAKDAGVGTVVTQVVPFPWGRRVPVVYEYQRVYGTKAGRSYDFSSLEGYIAAKVLVEGLRRAGKQLTRDKLIRALETINSRNYNVGGFNIHFMPGNHNGSKYVDITAITRNAKLVN